MNELSRFEQFTAAARHEAVPRLDVRGTVLRDLRATVASRSVDAPLALFSGAALIAATITAAWVLPMWWDLAEPLSSLFDVLSVVMQ
jgi:hypothetical protein